MRAVLDKSRDATALIDRPLGLGLPDPVPHCAGEVANHQLDHVRISTGKIHPHYLSPKAGEILRFKIFRTVDLSFRTQVFIAAHGCRISINRHLGGCMSCTDCTTIMQMGRLLSQFGKIPDASLCLCID